MTNNTELNIDQQPLEEPMKNKEADKKGARHTWDRRYKANRSAAYRNAVKAVKRYAKKHAKNVSRNNRKQLKKLLPKGLRPTLTEGAVSIYVITH